MRGDRGEVLLIGFGYVKNSEGVGEVRPRCESYWFGWRCFMDDGTPVWLMERC